MKKMVCEICESQSIKKENGVFVCQECGTEYSLEDAKKLLKEVSINETSNSIKNENSETTTNSNNLYSERKQNKGELLNLLLMWANSIKSLTEQKFYKVDLANKLLWEGKDSLEEYSLFKLGTSFKWTKTPTKEYIKDSNLLKSGVFLQEEKSNLVANNFPLDISFAICMLSKQKDRVNNFVNYLENTYNEFLNANKNFEKDILNDYPKAFIYSISNDDFKLILQESLDIGNCKNYFIKKNYSNTSLQQFEQNELIDYLRVLYFFGYFTSSNLTKFDFNRGSYYRTVDIDNFSKFERKFSYKKSLFKEVTESRNVDFNFDVEKFKSMYKEIYNTFELHTNEFVNDINNIRETTKNNIISTLEFSSELSKEFNLPIKYRNLNSLIPMIELILDGRAETWIDAVNLFEDEKFKSQLLNKLDNISSKLEKISNSINNIYLEVQMSNKLQYLTTLQLNKLNRQIKLSNDLELYKQFGIV